MTGHHNQELRARAAAVDAALTATYPAATCELSYRSPYELLVATILSAQCTDVRVNMVTPALFARFPDATALAGADRAELEELIRSTGFFRNKATSLLGMAQVVVERHGGQIPADMDALTALPGVGRKTANVVLGTAWGLATGVVVDTHVSRLSQRLGLTRERNAEKIERDLMALFPPSSWIDLSHRLILHGRRVCQARKPACDRCSLAAICPRIGV
ncbi:MAG: endonuclease III [Thermoanaerobaculaceae bacterium]|nr:endonuclease III [Thermoanaerobaculaceae bacterium]MDI9622124.1 endonuclease III [Acidobacteriota bacterium]NLH12115.1 endonuclease III [Holophagae bacterium]HPW56122.1 endonuclease III [Thermoanaerobaculaceae bacterium]